MQERKKGRAGARSAQQLRSNFFVVLTVYVLTASGSVDSKPTKTTTAVAVNEFDRVSVLVFSAIFDVEPDDKREFARARECASTECARAQQSANTRVCSSEKVRKLES
eukprot:IDg20099t1